VETNPLDYRFSSGDHFLLAQVAHFVEKCCHFFGSRRGEHAYFPKNPVVENARNALAAM
jgi:hypothetical protein